MALRPGSLSDMGVLVPDLNPVLMSGRGARELVGLADLYNDGELSLIPGTTAKTSAPILASITNANSATTFSNGSKIVTDTTAATDFMTNTDAYKRAYPGDFLLGNDNKLYVIDSVDSDTQITLKTAYEGDDASSSTSYTIIHRVWMLQQFAQKSSGLTDLVEQEYRTAETGTLTNTDWRSGFGVFLGRDRASSYSMNLDATEQLGYSSGYRRLASKFRVTSSCSVSWILMGLYYSAGTTTRTFDVRIETDSGGSPSGTLVDANATTGATTIGSYTSTDKKYKVTFGGAFTLSTATDYWIVIRTLTGGGAWTWGTDKFGVHVGANSSSETLIDHRGVGKRYDGTNWVTWSNPIGQFQIDFSLCTYYASGTNTYVGETMDLGATPASTATISATATRGSSDYYADKTSATYPKYHLRQSDYPYASPAYPDTLTVTIQTSAALAMTNPSTVVSASSTLTHDITKQHIATTANVNTTTETITLSTTPTWAVGTQVLYSPAGGTAITYNGGTLTAGTVYYIQAITGADIKLSLTSGGAAIDLTGTGNNSQYFYAKALRYWQFTYAMTSATGESTPLVTGASVTLTDSTSVGDYHDVAGVGPNVYRAIFGTPSTVSTSEVPSGNPAGAAVYQRKLWWTTGGGVPRYWDGLSAAAANVSAIAYKSDGTTVPTDPSYRADRLAVHNDKLFLYRYVSGASGTTYTGASTDLSNTVLTDDTSTPWPSTTDWLAGWRLYPVVTDASAGYHYPLKYWIVTASNTTTITVAGANMLSWAASTDTYVVGKFYRKTAWHSDEVEPMHWPSTNVVQFNDEDTDLLQHLESWNGRLVAVCRSQVWLVQGYGPTSPWNKSQISPVGGTLSPWSVVDAGDALCWWGVRGIYAYGGGYQRPVVISDAFRTIVLEDLNLDARDQVVGVRYRGLVLWSYPSATSNVNNKTIIYNPETGKWAVQDFGMYCPAIFMGSDGEEELIFQAVTTAPLDSGKLCQWDDVAYQIDGREQSISLKTSYFVTSSPTETAQGIRVRVSLVAGGDMDLNVYYALDYQDTYTLAGALNPIDSSVTGRTGVSASDTVYICALPAACQGSAISIQLSGSSGYSLRVMSVELDTDAQESNTNG